MTYIRGFSVFHCSFKLLYINLCTCLYTYKFQVYLPWQECLSMLYWYITYAHVFVYAADLYIPGMFISQECRSLGKNIFSGKILYLFFRHLQLMATFVRILRDSLMIHLCWVEGVEANDISEIHIYKFWMKRVCQKPCGLRPEYSRIIRAML